MKHSTIKHIIHYGSDEHVERLLKDPNVMDNSYLRVSLVRRPNSKFIDLVHDYQKRHFKRHDTTGWVESNIAAYGSDKHRQELIDHPNQNVRDIVARFGNKEQATHLLYDPTSLVKFSARTRLKELENATKNTIPNSR